MTEGNAALRSADVHNIAVPVPHFADRARSWVLVGIVICVYET